MLCDFIFEQNLNILSIRFYFHLSLVYSISNKALSIHLLFNDGDVIVILTFTYNGLMQRSCVLALDMLKVYSYAYRLAIVLPVRRNESKRSVGLKSIQSLGSTVGSAAVGVRLLPCCLHLRSLVQF